MQEDKARLQQEAEKLAQRLQAVLSEKSARRGTFDAETPIDKTLSYLQNIISVSDAAKQVFEDTNAARKHMFQQGRVKAVFFCHTGHGM